MAEPDPISLACIGCGTFNPPGAATCAGCGYEFAVPIREPEPIQLGPVVETREFVGSRERRPEYRVEESVSGFAQGFLRFLGFVAMTILGLLTTVIALAMAVWIAFGVMCSGRNDPGFFGFGLGILIAGGLAISGMIGVSRWLRKTSNDRWSKYR